MDFNKNMNQLMQEAQKMQEKMQEAQNQLNNLTIKGRSGKREVEITMNGRHDVTNVQIKPDLIKEDISIIEELIAAAINDAVRKVEKESKDKIQQLTSGLDIAKDFLNKDKD